MKIKTSELTGPALDWAVAKCEGRSPSIHEYSKGHGDWYIFMQTGVYRTVCSFSDSWSQGGPIIERELISVVHTLTTEHWIAVKFVLEDQTVRSSGNTPLIAAMRCFVASKLGDEVDVPGELR